MTSLTAHGTVDNVPESGRSGLVGVCGIAVNLFADIDEDIVVSLSLHMEFHFC